MAAVAPPGSTPSAALTKLSVPPNQSLYLQNLPEKLPKDDLKRALYMLFSTYGPVVDVNALKTAKMRGQAHVLFKDVQTATQAMRQCQGSEFFGKEMRISYSKNRSDTLAKLTGIFNPPATATEQPKQSAPGLSSFVPPPGIAPPTALPAPTSGLPPPPSLPPKVNGDAAGLKALADEPQDVASPQGVKRQRDESDDEAAMDEDDDDEGGEMEMSDDDD